MLSPSPKARIEAATALGETRREAAAEVLVAAFAREDDVDAAGAPNPKAAILRALGMIGGGTARDAVLLILDQYLERGPSDSRYIQDDVDYNAVVTTAISALTSWHGDPGVLDRLRGFVMDQSEPRKLAWWMREEAYRGCLLAEMAKEQLPTATDRARWLLERLTTPGTGSTSDWLPGMTGEKTPEAVKNGATLRLLTEQGAGALGAVKSALAETPEDDYRRTEALARIIVAICRQAESARQGDAGHNE